MQEVRHIRVEIPADLHQALKLEAVRRGMSLRDLVVQALTEWKEEK